MRPIFSVADCSVATVSRFCIICAALLFALSAILGSLPDSAPLQEQLDRSALAGYEQVSLTTPHRQPILEEYYDYLPKSAASSVTSRVPEIQ